MIPNIVVISWLVLGMAVCLYLAGAVMALLFPARKGEDPGKSTRIMLVLLRLAIGWHFLGEGVEKLENPAWTADPYLRESIGPLAPVFRKLAGDRTAERLTVTVDKGLPVDLDIDWGAYLNAFQSFYKLDEQQQERAGKTLEQVKSNIAVLLSIKPKLVEKIAPYPPPLQIPMTMPERLQEYQNLQAKVVDIENDLMIHYGSDAFEAYKTAKANVGKWRSGLQKDLAGVNKEMKRALVVVLLDGLGQKLPAEESKKVQDSLAKIAKGAKEEIDQADPQNWDEIDSIKEKWNDKTIETYRNVFFALEQKNPNSAQERDPQTNLVAKYLLERRKKDQPLEPLPFTPMRPLTTWSLLDLSDVQVKFGITAVGIMLLVGLLTRLTCLAGAGFLLMFWMAMPPLPGWPENPKAEGHYLFINKNFVEMVALLALATTRSGRWAGLDGVLQFWLPCCLRKTSAPVSINKE